MRFLNLALAFREQEGIETQVIIVKMPEEASPTVIYKGLKGVHEKNACSFRG